MRHLAVGDPSTALAATGRVGLRFRLGRVGGFAGLRQRLVELLRVQSRIVERVAATPVRQRQFGGHPDVLFVDGVGAAPGRVRDGGAGHHQVGAHPVDVERRAQRGDPS